MDDSNDSGNFSVRDYLSLIQKNSITHMHSPAVYVKEGLPFAWDLPLEKSADSYLCFLLVLLHSVLYLFPLSISFFLSMHSFDSISSKFSQSTCMLMCLSLETLTSIIRTGLTYSGGTDRPGELSYNSSISNDLTQVVNFPTRIHDCDSHSPALLDFFLSDTSICSKMAFTSFGNSDHLVVSVSTDIPTNSKQDTPIYHIVYDYSCAD